MGWAGVKMVQRLGGWTTNNWSILRLMTQEGSHPNTAWSARTQRLDGPKT